MLIAALLEKFAKYIFKCDDKMYLADGNFFPKGNNVSSDSTYSQDPKYVYLP